MVFKWLICACYSFRHSIRYENLIKKILIQTTIKMLVNIVSKLFHIYTPAQKSKTIYGICIHLKNFLKLLDVSSLT